LPCKRRASCIRLVAQDILHITEENRCSNHLYI
jgi:hypothetical protein